MILCQHHCLHDSILKSADSALSHNATSKYYYYIYRAHFFILIGLEEDEEESLKWSRWILLPRKYYYRQFVRSVSLVNLFILVLSLPWQSDSEKNFVQFVCITVADFSLACLYTVNFTIRICYWWHLKTMKKTDSVSSNYIILSVHVHIVHQWDMKFPLFMI